MKKFIAGLLTGVFLVFSFPVMAETVRTIEVYLDRVKLEVNGQMTDTPTLLYDGRTYIQLRSAAEAFSAELEWNESTNTASLNTAQPAQVKITDTNEIQSANPNITLNNSTSIEAYLNSYYSEFDTSQGKCKIEFNVMDNWLHSNYDFHIEAELEWDFYYNNLSLAGVNAGRISGSQRNTLIEEMKQYMEMLAKDLIGKLPGKKLYGLYNYSWYDYPTIREGLNSYNYCSWSNYPYNALESYDLTQASNEIYWNTKYDD